MDLKKIAGQAGQFLTRAVQYTEEKFGSAEKTEYDGHFENLAHQCDTTKLWTEKLSAGVQAVVIPNPGNRVEDFLYEKIEKRRPNRLSNLEYVGLDMVQAGNDFGPGTSYGASLLKVGGAQQRLGAADRDFINSAIQSYIQPLNKFLDTEMKTIIKERKILESKRLDLDVCKSRVRKARSVDAQASAESELRRAQADFDRQTEITKLLLEGARSSHASHLRYLNEFVEAQADFYKQCHKIMEELQKEMASIALGSDGSVEGILKNSPYPSLPVKDSDENEWRRARVVCNYEATSSEELSLAMDQIVYVSSDKNDKDFVLARCGSKKGKVPRAYLDSLDD